MSCVEKMVKIHYDLYTFMSKVVILQEATEWQLRDDFIESRYYFELMSFECHVCANIIAGSNYLELDINLVCI